MEIADIINMFDAQFLLIAAFVSMILTQLVKGSLPEKAKPYMTYISIVIGVFSSIFANSGWSFGMSVADVVLAGLVIGWSGTGLYEMIKPLVKSSK